MLITVKSAATKSCRVGFLVPQALTAIMAEVASKRMRMKMALMRGGRLDTAALMMSRRDVIRLISRMTRKARNSLHARPR